jgi:hypothetical protein
MRILIKKKQNIQFSIALIANVMRKVWDIFFKVFMFAFFSFPLYWMFSTAFKSYKESILFPPSLIPGKVELSAFAEVFQKIDFLQFGKNSILVSISVVLLQALVSVPAAYGFARYSFKGKKLLWGIVMLSLMIPLQITFIPVYILFAKMKILGTLLPQILPFIANGYGIFLIRQSFLQLPKELMESAYLDGAGEKEILTYIAIPHAKASILSAILISFISTWNSYFWPFVMTNKESNMPLTLAMQRLQDANQGVEWPTIMAANSILTLPVLILFLLLSKQILLSFGYQEEK